MKIVLRGKKDSVIKSSHPLLISYTGNWQPYLLKHRLCLDWFTAEYVPGKVVRQLAVTNEFQL